MSDSALFIMLVSLSGLCLFGLFLYLEGPKICIKHKPKKTKFVDPITPSITHIVQYCPHCRKMKYIEE